jgi:hypothetical protein
MFSPAVAEAVRPPVPVLQAHDRPAEGVCPVVGLVRSATSAGCAHGDARLDWWRKAHEERKSNQDGDDEAAQNAA